MIGCIRETGLAAPLASGALLATMLAGLSACAELPFSAGEQTDGRPAVADPAPAAVVQHGPAPEERMPPPFQVAEPQPAPPMPRDKPALVLTVSYGDTLSEIAYRHGVATVAIIELNGLRYPYYLHTGQRLALPRATLAAARRGEPPAEASHYANGEPVLTVAATKAEPAPPVRVKRVNHTRTVTASPAPRVHVEPVEPAPPVQAEAAAPEPPRSPGPRTARAEPEATPPTPTLYALTRQPDTEHVPLPPTRNTFLWPLEGRVISGFGAKPGGKHNDGINIAVPVGSEVRASQNGVVAYAGNELRGYGNLVLLRHDGGWMTAYAHNETLLVGKGDVVRRGQVISRSGRSGGVSRPQAHFEIRRDGEPQDPLRLLSRK